MSYLPWDLEDRTSAAVMQALESRCKLCHVPKDELCLDITQPDKPLLHASVGRYVHHVRAELP